MQIDIPPSRANRELIDTIHEAWAMLPPDVQRKLNGVRFTQGKHAAKAWATAGDNDVDIQALPLSTTASVAVLCHELAHVLLNHPRQLRTGIKSAAQIEQECDALVRAWGLTTELAEAYQFNER